MKDAAKGAASFAAVGANQITWQGALSLLNTRFAWGLSALECVAIAGGLATVFHAIVKYGRPIAAALYRRLLAAVGAVFVVSLLAFPVSAAPGSRLVLIEGEERTILEELPNGEVAERVERRDVLYLDWSIALDLVLVDMRRPREFSIGAIPGVGWGLRWCPEWWSLSDAFLGLDLVLGGGLEIPEGDAPTGATISGLLALTVGNLGSIGAGFRARVGFGDFPDDVVPTLALGLRYSP